MAEFLALIGGISAAGGIIGAITKTVQNLYDAQVRYEGADLSIRLLITELTTIKASLIEIEDWAKNSLGSHPRQRELLEGFRVSLEGCEVAMRVLAEEVAELVSKNPFKRRAQYVWNEDGMRDHQDRLRSQVAALQLLLQAARCRTEMQQAKLLQQPENRQIIRKVADDTSTLRSTINNTRSGTPTVVAHPESTIGPTVFGVDEVIVNSGPYLRNMERHTSKKSEDKAKRTVSDATNPFRGTPLTVVTQAESNADSGFYDMDADIVNPVAYRQTVAEAKNKHDSNIPQRSVSDGSRYNHNNTAQRDPANHAFLEAFDSEESKDQLSPMERFKAEPWQKPQPYTRVKSPGSSVSQRDGGRPVRHHPSASAPAIPQQSSVPNRQKSQEVKKSLWGSLKKIPSRAGLAPPAQSRTSSSPGGSLSPSPGSRRVKRQTELNVHSSIDFGSVEGLKAPTIVRAAQSGSRIEIERLLEQRSDIEQRHDRSGRTALAVASHCGNEDIVALLLSRGAKVDVLDASSMTPLHLAASRGHYQVVEYLVDDHADVNARGSEGKSPLRFAADNGHYEVAELLLQHRAKANARDRQNSTALHFAATIGDEAMVKLLIGHGADLEAKDGELMAALHYAAEADRDAVVETLLINKADIEAVGKAGMTPLSCACSAGAYRTVNILLARKANIKHKGEGDMTPLHWASYNDHAEVADLLLQKRASIDVRTSDGMTPLHLASMTKSFAAAELLLRKGANTEAQCNSSLRPIHHACRNSDIPLVQLLLGSGAQIEAVSGPGLRPLHISSMGGSSSLVELLLRKGAMVDVRDAGGHRPVIHSCMHGHVDAVRVLLDRGAAMRAKLPMSSLREDSPLCKAAEHGHLPIVIELIKRGASVYQKDEGNWWPLRYAAYHGHPDIVDFLLKKGASVLDQYYLTTTDQIKDAWKMDFASDVDEAGKIAVSRLLEDAKSREQERLGPRRVAVDDAYQSAPQFVREGWDRSSPNPQSDQSYTRGEVDDHTFNHSAIYDRRNVLPANTAPSRNPFEQNTPPPTQSSGSVRAAYLQSNARPPAQDSSQRLRESYPVPPQFPPPQAWKPPFPAQKPPAELG